MAIKVENQVPLLDLMALLNCNAELMQAVQQSHLMSEITTEGVVISTSNVTQLLNPAQGIVKQIAPMQWKALEWVLNNKAGPSSKAVMRIGLEKAIKVVLKACLWKLPATTEEIVPSSEKPSLVNPKEHFLKKAAETVAVPVMTTGASTTGMFTATEKDGIFDLSEPASVIKLKDATEIGQQVAGTDAGSIYRVVAISEKCKMAARRKGSVLSVRVEGPGASDFANVGMKGSPKGYYSIHLTSDDQILLRKSLGALIFGTGTKWDKVCTSLST